ncbi:aromatic ring-hydroxylating dioxygenase subunit alpha [Bacteriovoracaceae bacterium]|nr:aromatic ring-hydroxylating dioxygenase subunit alpha [Bacteriovoracaceae bacterium]
MSDLISRDGHLINNWYIACLESDLRGGPIQRTLYDQKIVLFKNKKDQKVSAFIDRCLHRMAKLSEGRVENNCLVCPYHSWHYDENGEVTKVPSEGPTGLKGKRKIKSFPCEVKDGVVWLWMGADEPSSSPTWDFPYYGEKGWIHYYMVTDFNNEVTNLAENFMDVPHTVSVHKGWFRNESLKKVPMTTATSEGSVLVSYHQPDDNIGVLIRPILNPKNEPMVHTDKYIFPNITRVDYSFGSHYKYVINSQITPVSTMKSRVYTYIAYKIPVIGSFLKPFISYYTRKVIEQDVWIMDVQSENYEKEIQNPRFQSTPADEPHIQIEKLRDYGIAGDEKVFSTSKSVDTDIWI